MGYDMLSKQTTPPAVWMQYARTDLAEEYDALHQPQLAIKLRAELAANENKSPETARKN
jgi:hypothetical protein